MTILDQLNFHKNKIIVIEKILDLYPDCEYKGFSNFMPDVDEDYDEDYEIFISNLITPNKFKFRTGGENTTFNKNNIYLTFYTDISINNKNIMIYYPYYLHLGTYNYFEKHPYTFENYKKSKFDNLVKLAEIEFYKAHKNIINVPKRVKKILMLE